MKALLVIDMQKGSFTPKTPRFDTEGVVERINSLAGIFRELNRPVIFIQHDGTKMGEFMKGAKDWEQLDEIVVKEEDIFIDKYVNDVFYNSKLQATLDSLNINELFITGCATDFCIEATIQSAIAKDYNMTIVSDGHTTGDKPHLKAAKIIEHYNWVWQHMIPTKGNVSVRTSNEIKMNIKQLTTNN